MAVAAAVTVAGAVAMRVPEKGLSGMAGDSLWCPPRPTGCSGGACRLAGYGRCLLSRGFHAVAALSAAVLRGGGVLVPVLGTAAAPSRGQLLPCLCRRPLSRLIPPRTCGGASSSNDARIRPPLTVTSMLWPCTWTCGAPPSFSRLFATVPMVLDVKPAGGLDPARRAPLLSRWGPLRACVYNTAAKRRSWQTASAETGWDWPPRGFGGSSAGRWVAGEQGLGGLGVGRTSREEMKTGVSEASGGPIAIMGHTHQVLIRPM